MQNFYLVRHAQYANPRQIMPDRLVVLSKTGIAEAQQLARFFANKDIEMIYSSPVKCCQQTSQIIAAEQIPITYE